MLLHSRIGAIASPVTFQPYLSRSRRPGSRYGSALCRKRAVARESNGIRSGPRPPLEEPVAALTPLPQGIAAAALGAGDTPRMSEPPAVVHAKSPLAAFVVGEAANVALAL